MRPRDRWAWGSAWSVRARMLALIVAVMTAGLTVTGLVSYGLQYRALTERVDAELAQNVSELAQLAQAGPAQDGQPFKDVHDLFLAYLTTAVAGENEAMLAMVDGKVDFFSGGARSFDVAHEDVLAAVRAVPIPAGQARVSSLDSQGTQLRVLVADVQLPGESRTANFVVANDIGAQRVEVRRHALTYALLAVLVLAAVAGLAHLLLGRLLRPLNELRAATAVTSTEDLTRRVAVSGADTDVAELVVRYNAMLDRIESGVQQQRQFLDDAAHELRTPLTILRGNAELLSAEDPDDVEATRTLVLDEVDRMQRLVDDLLMLTRLHRPDFLRPAPTDVTELAVEAMDRVTVLGQRRWRLSASAEGTMPLDRHRVLQAMVQLVANGVKFSEPDSVIEVASAWAYVDSVSARAAVAAGAHAADRYLMLSVRDEGIGIPMDQQERVFERFSRADNVGQAEGSGLGLPIVRLIAQAHGGAVGLSSTEGVGSTFWLALPDLHDRSRSVSD